MGGAIKEVVQVLVPVATLVLTLVLLVRQAGHTEGENDAELHQLRARVDELRLDADRLAERLERHYMPRREAEALMADLRRAIDDLREWRARREK